MTANNTIIADMIEHRKNTLAEAVVARCWEETPQLAIRYDDSGRQKCIEDVTYHLSYLSNAIAVSSPELFTDYVNWAQALLDGLGIPPNVVTNSLRAIIRVLEAELPSEMAETTGQYVSDAVAALTAYPNKPGRSPITAEPLSVLAQQYVDILLEGDRHAASRLILEAVESGATIQDIYLNVLQPAQIAIGQLWHTGRISVAHEHLCSATTQLIMSQLYSRIFTSRKNGRTMVAACVAGDLHEIGCRMVADFFEMQGWDTLFFGANTPTPSIIQAIRQHGAEVLAISATMSFHLRGVIDLIAAVRAADLNHNVTIIVGGYCFNIAPDLWRKVGADLYACNAQEALVRLEEAPA
jgi:methanogenic corrinoid protein MtbC1